MTKNIWKKLSKLYRIGNRITRELSNSLFDHYDVAKKMISAKVQSYQRQRIEAIFNSAVHNFYDAYQPGYYNRTDGLYNVLDLHVNQKTGEIMYNLKESNYNVMFNPDKLHKDRSGGDLFQKVFVEGWHGGAESGSGHPSNGTPYYREPHPYYSRWGRRAVQTESPYNLIMKELTNARREFAQKRDEIETVEIVECLELVGKDAQSIIATAFRGW